MNFKKNKPLSSAQRKRRERDKKRESGLVPIEIWIKPEWKYEVKNLINELNGKEK